MFTKVQCYCSGHDVSFDKIKNSCRPFITINTECILSLGPKTDWGFCERCEDYPYRIMTMCNNDRFFLVLESADELENLLLKNNDKEDNQ